MKRVSESLPSIDLSWDGASIVWKDQAGVMHADATSVDESESLDISALPSLPIENILLGRVYIPMEWLLVRYVSLPLKQPSMVDVAILFQELADSSDLDANDWWLTWHLHVCESGVAGMVFGLPESLRTSMLASEPWLNVKEVLVDGYERLHVYAEEGQACLVLDQDDEGVFFGVYDGQIWRGMRRLNGDVEALWQQLLHSCSAMGFDAQNDVVCGQVYDALLDKVKAANLTWQGEHLNTQRTRHEANLNICQGDEKGALNLRHGRWSSRREWGHLHIWKRSAVLACLVLLAWITGTVIDLHRMDNKIEIYKQRIQVAFHKGLPNEPVMLDALAQLRQAAGGEGVADTTFLSSLQAVSKAYQAQAWQLKTLELREGEMHMTGEIKDIKSLNKIQTRLQKNLQKKVSIADTNMSGEKVSFRMHW
jgi:hypothetical protein